METKICSSCGQKKLVDNFRPYYGGRNGRYSYCKDCEKIAQRRKYLLHRPDLTDEEAEELEAIETLYTKRKEAGLKIIGSIRSKTGVSTLVQKELSRFENM